MERKMVNINFIPDDYIRNNESRRINLICIALLSIILVAIVGAFGAIRMRQRTLNIREASIDTDLTKKKGQIKTIDQLQKQRNTMWSTALMTVELIDPVPKSMLLASLTNSLPKGVSFLRLSLIQKEQAANSQQQKNAANKYEAMQDKEKTAAAVRSSKEKMLDTQINIEGVAPSDIEVAAYIEQLSRSALLTDVALVESVQMPNKSSKQDSQEGKMRRFKLSALLRKDIQITEKDVEQIAYNSGAETALGD
jgi:Tfp pilus assembly protein PilN